MNFPAADQPVCWASKQCDPLKTWETSVWHTPSIYGLHGSCFLLTGCLRFVQHYETRRPVLARVHPGLRDGAESWELLQGVFEAATQLRPWHVFMGLQGVSRQRGGDKTRPYPFFIHSKRPHHHIHRSQESKATCLENYRNHIERVQRVIPSEQLRLVA